MCHTHGRSTTSPARLHPSHLLRLGQQAARSPTPPHHAPPHPLSPPHPSPPHPSPPHPHVRPAVGLDGPYGLAVGGLARHRVHVVGRGAGPPPRRGRQGGVQARLQLPLPVLCEGWWVGEVEGERLGGRGVGDGDVGEVVAGSTGRACEWSVGMAVGGCLPAPSSLTSPS